MDNVDDDDEDDDDDDGICVGRGFSDDLSVTSDLTMPTMVSFYGPTGERCEGAVFKDHVRDLVLRLETR